MTEKLKMEQNPMSPVFEAIKQVCPGAVNDNGTIDFDVLKSELSDSVVEGQRERYEFDWVGKENAKREYRRKIRKTLRPQITDSKNWETTKNLYIEGDNLDALKLLQKSYLHKVQIIYIDPPYNTGNDFVYCDDFAEDCKQYLDKKEVCDADGNRLFVNKPDNGQYHSNWCNMMYPRLKIAKDLLADHGVIFISIDDNEVVNLRKICDEVFGENNFVSCFIVTSAPAGTQSATNVSVQHSYCLCYAKCYKKIKFSINRTKEELANRYTEHDKKGSFYCERLWKRGVGGKKEDVPSLHFPVYFNPLNHQILVDKEYNGEKDFIKIIPYHTAGVLGRWTWSRESMISKRDNLIVKRVSGEWKLHKKVYDFEETGKLPFSIIGADIGRTEIGGLEVKAIFEGQKLFEYPKGVDFIKHFLSFSQNQDNIVLDFFSGSATTAHSVMQLNAEDGGSRKFIMVQLPEPTAEDSEAFKAGYKNICEIGKERIRRAGDKIVAETGKTNLDIGFRVLRVDSSNMKEVYYKPSDTKQSGLLDLVDNIEDGRTDMDLLFGVMVDCGLPLDMPIETKTSHGKTYYVVNNADLIACFEDSISEDLIREIAEQKPICAVFKDSSFAEAKDKVNVSEIFKNFCGDDKCLKIL